ncbi:type II toxin-antitoxin system HicB family antitoxin [Candidatus Micrarchaeota archaeon]|nr:type II toxin-antitoxin system HicB family antitoxin [Candidatus Micrarchaeota archaeon]
MTNEFTVVIEEGEDGCLISEVVELPGCHTQAKTLYELMRRTKEAIALYLKVEGAGEELHKFIGVQKVAV